MYTEQGDDATVDTRCRTTSIDWLLLGPFLSSNFSVRTTKEENKSRVQQKQVYFVVSLRTQTGQITIWIL